MCSCYAHLLLTQHACCHKHRPPHHSCQLSCSLEGQCGPSWSLLDPIMETGVCRVLGQLGQNTDQWVALDHPSSSWGQAGDRSCCRWSSSTSLSKRKRRAAQHSLGPSALPLSQELYRCLFSSSPQPSPLCNNLERRQELLRSLPPQPGWGTWQRVMCPSATSGAGLLGLGHRKRDFRRADKLLRQPLCCSVYKGRWLLPACRKSSYRILLL